jgi:hypothetical protein
MKLEDQVCSLELAKKLKELGVKQESYFYWEWFSQNGKACLISQDGWKINKMNTSSAFTVAELGLLLPSKCYTKKDRFPIEWFCYRYVDENQEDVWISDTEANARAEMLIYLIDNKLI